MQTQEERERHLRELAAKLMFDVEARGNRYTLSRETDPAQPVRHENLTLEQAEEVLKTWKLSGFHGG
jgi:hypothetical protein